MIGFSPDADGPEEVLLLVVMEEVFGESLHTDLDLVG